VRRIGEGKNWRPEKETTNKGFKLQAMRKRSVAVGLIKRKKLSGSHHSARKREKKESEKTAGNLNYDEDGKHGVGVPIEGETITLIN